MESNNYNYYNKSKWFKMKIDDRNIYKCLGIYNISKKDKN